MTGGEKTYEPATCRHCDGEGCLYCNRTGTVLVLAPKRPCRHCDGVGCIYCGFTGWTEPKGKYD
jgi:DnaJ-class molecular chaperone